ncbi:MAG TPA: DUF4149 domain-containing protein [Candidatus Deferrimicrobiaceae bacterium]
MPAAAAALYRIALALWLGGMTVYTFVMTPIIFKAYGRDAAGAIVGTMMPTYFRYIVVLVSLAIAARLLAGEAGPGVCRIVGTGLLASALFVSAYHTFVLLPQIESVKKEVVSFETTPKDAPARKAFSRLHGVSMALNLLLLAEGLVLVAGADWFRRPSP